MMVLNVQCKEQRLCEGQGQRQDGNMNRGEIMFEKYKEKEKEGT